ncbi:endolytic transglycosylase MltG [Lichenibacterium minor]|uniref:Endolytic murein transglycosylase n=1 Tax=Lichenibacterium minor TaxID=2316528 RepID=A0A4Q2UD55_9HYPH|nr:endolytic transglycosylase MltG [Lichenibacterium minor]RYC33006.1 endolytic transglycosylase MltG [Lichenibacterium minor]
MAEGPNPIDGAHPDRDAASAGARRGLMTPGEALQPDPVPPPPPGPRRSRPILATVSGILSFLGIAAVALVILVSLAIQRIDAPGPLPSDKVVIISPGTDVGDIVGQLEQEGVIDSATLMSGTLYAEGERSKIKAGEYMFKQSASLRDVIDTLVSGHQILHAITVPEGLTSEQICDRLKADDVLTGEIRAVPKEGTLMPDTFKFARGTTREQLLRTMAQEQRKIVADVWSHRAADTPIRSPYDMVTLASIVEKETGKADERPRVAGVFVNRLVKGIPLQSDPTIVYGLVGGKATLGRGILKSEIEQKTPYNTYAISGLPPGPICNPGRAALEAVANPSRTKDVYFVADGTGGHAFAETLDQHRQNVQRWRALEKDAKDKAAPDAGAAPAAVPGSPAPGPKQRSDAAPSVPVYGALTGRFEPASSGPDRPASLLAGVTRLPSELDPGGDIATRFAPPTPDQTASLDPDGPGDLAPAPTDSNSYFGVGAAGSGEERALAGANRDPGLSFPVSPAQRADERARAARYGTSTGPDTLPPAAEVVSAEQGAPLAPNRPMAGKGVITDASEGTALDPLRDKSYDLMSAKTVPVAMSAAYAPRPNPYGPRSAAPAPKPARATRTAAKAKPAHAAGATDASPAPAAQ